MREVQFIRAAWLELAAANYPDRVRVYSYTVQVPDFPEVNQGQVPVQTPEKCKAPLFARFRPAA
jgi:hypothetical protein